MSIVHDAASGTVIASVVTPPGSLLEIVPIPKAALPGALGAGMAGAPPGSVSIVIDDGTIPVFTMVMVDAAGTWVRVDAPGTAVS